MRILYSGLDVGSTTCKFVVFDEETIRDSSNRKPEFIFSKYQKHNSDVTGTTIAIIQEFLAMKNIEYDRIKVAVTGSGGFQVAEKLHIPYIQEVVACMSAVERMVPETDVVIELGGEDAKVSYMGGKEGSNVEVRMNGSCAGGTGAMIETLAALIDTDLGGLNALAEASKQIHPIASRCSVFAKTDVQALINENCEREDIAASVLQAVVNQTLGGLACGRPVRGNITFLGGPLYFLSSLRNLFINSIPDLTPENAVCPENAQLFVAMGAAMSDPAQFEFDEATAVRVEHGFTAEDLDQSIRDAMENRVPETVRLDALFENSSDLDNFKERHSKAVIPIVPLASSGYDGPLYVGIDAGSTTTKVVLMDDNKNIVWSHYGSNGGSPLESTRKALIAMYEAMPEGCKARVVRGAATGYGEELVKSALGIEDGVVETMAHLHAAAHFQPNVESVLDIGGQDMKFMRVEDGAVTSVVLNEACSAGCGSFLQTYASTVGLSLQEFTDLAVSAKSPVDLGSRCTVFMNSRVKQMQKEGVDVADISAGICISVIKNCLYKTMRIRDVSELGKHVVVQGGTFINNAVLRAFESLINVNVIRPSGEMAGLMGAYGACLHAQMKAKETATVERLMDLAEEVPERLRHSGPVCASHSPNAPTPVSGIKAIDAVEGAGGADIEDLEVNIPPSTVETPACETSANDQSSPDESEDSHEAQENPSESAIPLKNRQTPKNFSSRGSASDLCGIDGSDKLVEKTFDDSLRSMLSAMPETSILSEKDLKDLTWTTRSIRCRQCENQCLMTLSRFSDGTRHISGNRCERGAGSLAVKNNALPGSVESAEDVPNTYLWKMKRLFGDVMTSNDLKKDKVDIKKKKIEKEKGDVDIEDVLTETGDAASKSQKRVKKQMKKDKKHVSRKDTYIGIPRALSQWEDIMLWHTFFTELGFTPVVSPPTSKPLFESALETIPSDTVCYPAKLVHGHVHHLLGAGVKHVWLPLVPLNRQSHVNGDDHFNCPIVAGYPEALESSMHDVFEEAGAIAHSPALPVYHNKRLSKRLLMHLNSIGEETDLSAFTSITHAEVKRAVAAGLEALDKYYAELRAEGERALLFARTHGMRTIVLAGRPYHADPGISHGIAKLLRTMGLVVVSEDAIFHLANDNATTREGVLQVRNQWSYHHRLYAAAHVAASLPFVEFVQLVSFGCGLDAITSDQCKDILTSQNQLYTGLKIDEQSNLGAAKIRIRSLIAASEEREGICRPVALADSQNAAKQSVEKREKREAELPPLSKAEKKYVKSYRKQQKKANKMAKITPEHKLPAANNSEEAVALREIVRNHEPATKPVQQYFTKEMRDDGWILLGPQMSPWHMPLYEAAVHGNGNNIKVVDEVTQEDIDFGLKIVHNDACYPALVIIGSLVRAVADPERRKELGVDVNKVALIITSTGGQCRASNYVSLLRRALQVAGVGHVPVISLSAQRFEMNTGFTVGLPAGVRMAYATLFGDLLMRLTLRTRPYEKTKGDTMRVYQKCMDRAVEELRKPYTGSATLPFFKKRHFRRIVRQTIDDYLAIPTVSGPHDKPRVLVIGEILVQYHPVANNQIVDYVEANGAEPVLPDMANFFLYCLIDSVTNREMLSGSWLSAKVCKIAVWYMEKFKKIIAEELRADKKVLKRYGEPSGIKDILESAKKLISPVCYAGEGWLIPGELHHYYHHDDLRSALILQPAFCLPNHVIGRGMQGRLRRELPGLATSAIDYDAGGLAEVNQQSRIKLLVSMALKDHKKRKAAEAKAGDAEVTVNE